MAKWFEGKKTKIAAVLMLIGAVGAYLTDDVQTAKALATGGLGIFGLWDKINRLEKKVEEASE